MQDAVIQVLEWTNFSPRKVQQDGAADGGEDLAAGVTLATEIEGGTSEGDEFLATNEPTATEATAPEPAEPTATPEPTAPAAATLDPISATSGEEIPTEPAPEENTTITRARRRRK